MKRLTEIFIYLNLQKRKEIAFETIVENTLSIIKEKNPKSSLIQQNFNSSYYGDPFPFDWHNTKIA